VCAAFGRFSFITRWAMMWLVAMKMMRSTKVMSTSGVTLMPVIIAPGF